jgi:hypothetical protein
MIMGGGRTIEREGMGLGIGLDCVVWNEMDEM